MASRRRPAVMEVLDTAALLAWPLEALLDGVCAPSQLAEVERLSPSRALLIESQGPRIQAPLSLDPATRAAKDTGDFSGLSDVDLDVLALAFELDLTLVTDDYRMQNVCAERGHPWRGVVQDGLTEIRHHVLTCTGCKAVWDEGEMCPDCGSALRLKRA